MTKEYILSEIDRLKSEYWECEDTDRSRELEYSIGKYYELLNKGEYDSNDDRTVQNTNRIRS